MELDSTISVQSSDVFMEDGNPNHQAASSNVQASQLPHHHPHDPNFVGPESMRKIQHLFDLNKKFVCFKAGTYSNWEKSSMEIDGLWYNCVEQYMMAEKGRLFNDTATVEKIMNAKEPWEQKELGRQVKNFKESTWKKHCDDIVERGCFEKFCQNERMMKEILATDDQLIVEASPADNIWGIGLGEWHKEAHDMATWKGTNLLGAALMRARERIRNGERSKSTNSVSLSSSSSKAKTGDSDFVGPQSMKRIQHLFDVSKPFVCFKAGVYSNWYRFQMKIDGKIYSCVEQYMMAEKAKLFEDWATMKLIMEANQPAEQKKLGRKVKNFNESVWKNHCDDIVEKGCFAKFTQDEHLMAEILATGDRVIVEASPADSIWGIGLGEWDPKAHNMATWKGTNLLGAALMRARERIRNGERSKTFENDGSQKFPAGGDLKPDQDEGENKSPAAKKTKWRKKEQTC